MLQTARKRPTEEEFDELVLNNNELPGHDPFNLLYIDAVVRKLKFQLVEMGLMEVTDVRITIYTFVYTFLHF